MAVTFDTTRFRIDVKDSAAKPAHAFIGDHMFGHLTRGFVGGKYVDDAITATASVPFTMAPDDDVQFGFVQLARAVTWKATYFGRVPAEGSIELDYFAPLSHSHTVQEDEALNIQNQTLSPQDTELFRSFSENWQASPNLIFGLVDPYGVNRYFQFRNGKVVEVTLPNC